MRPSGRCKGCLAPIRWGKHAKTGKPMPINPDADRENGNVWVVRYDDNTPIFEVASTPDQVPSSEPLRYTSHFATCPHPEGFRRR